MEEDVDDARQCLWLCVEVVGARNLESSQAVDAYCVVRVGQSGRREWRRSWAGDDAEEEKRDDEEDDDDDDDDGVVDEGRHGGALWRSMTTSATTDPTWRFRVETPLRGAGEAEVDGEEGDEHSELLVVEIFNEKNFFFDMFPESDRQQAEDVAISERSGSVSDSDEARVASPVSTLRNQRRRRRRSMGLSDDSPRRSTVQPIDFNASDEALGVVELSLALLRRRAARGVRATDEWYVLRGARSGEVRIRTLLQSARPPNTVEMSARWEELLVDPNAQVEDHYGFRIPPSSVREWTHLRSYHACREQRRVAEWETTFGSHFFSLPSARSSSVVKRLAREGIPRHWRQRVYMAMAGGLEKQAKAPTRDYYASLVEKIAMQDTVSFRQIELDIDRTFGHSGTKICTEEGRASLRRVLKAYSMHNPAVGYCQGLNFIVGFLSLLLDEESTFWLLAVICEDFYPGYYVPTMTDTQTDMLVLKQLIADELPELDQFTSDVGLPLELLGSQWLLCLFSTTFPAETVFRIFDCIMTEGPHFVFAVIMAHLRRLESKLLDLDEFQAVLSTMKESENALFDADDFIRLAVHEASHITPERVAQLREEHSVSVLNEMQRADRARALNRQLAVVYQIPAFSSTAANLLRFFHTEAETSSRSDVAFVLTLLCHGLVWLAEHSKHLRR